MQHNPKVTVSISYMFLYNFKWTYFLKSIPEVEDSIFYFLYHWS